ncbi:uncharacterized protein LOC119670525 [Teleopsis dalmanni]|uniref:uncharacterized protein LOC119670525 n=1 Tax=Teleopsis dalmanni TaxID=139649 RepID=UPI0018CDE98A|nr:uncharacterized protein LOC119670525 [Teleopsis dalmanni]
MNRSNSFVNSLKWWPLQGHNTNTGSNANGNTTFGSSVAVQKLRESKWFHRDEQRIFCAVIECGFIVEMRKSTASNMQQQNNSYEHEDMQDENETPVTWFGIVLCKLAKDNKPKPDSIEIYYVKIRENGTFKMIKLTLEDIWKNGWELRINNFADREKQPHIEKDIRNQVSFARKAKNSLWNNNKHFVYWCRYGSRQQDVRKRQMSECVKWGSVGMNAGMLLVMNKQKSYSTSK